jgi:transcriptional antiterminator NusG
LDWAVATTIPSTERRASDDLTSAGLSTYLPKIERAPEAIYGRIVKRRNLLFPGYLFFIFTEAWRHAFKSEYVTKVLGDPERPSVLPQSVMDDLQERVGPDGVLKFDETRKRRRFQIGQNVRMKQGPFAGLDATVACMLSGDERVMILLGVFSRMTRITVKETELSA